ncbi:tetratricopeptide repeat protein [Myxococcota bacterium]|nr:tetratricopeptide repeat protein [Myxococcota bacterium]
MLALAVALLATLPAELPRVVCSAGDVKTPEERALVAGAIGVERFAAGDVDVAITCLEEARALLPLSGTIARDLAIVYHAAGRLADALRQAELAMDLGERDPEVIELRAVLLARLGWDDEAREVARTADTWEGGLVAAALGDASAAYGVSELVEEETRRGAVAALVLATYAAERGDFTSARLLLDAGTRLAVRGGESDAEYAARVLASRLRARRGLGAASRLRLSLDHASNPAFVTEAPLYRSSGLRAALVAEGALHAPIGPARVDAVMRFDQHLFLEDRSALAEVELSGLSLEAGVEVPISRHPSAALIGVRARIVDTFGDALRVHYATTIEGGPTLALPIAAGLRVELGVFGVATDFIDRSPSSTRISSQNRDLVGRRATLVLDWEGEWVEGRAELMFLRDDARGDAFDARGGAAALRLRARPTEGLSISTGVALLGRAFGPVGDEAIIGDAAVRHELRTAIDVGAEIALGGATFLVVEDTWIRNDARRRHSYTENVLSVGVEQRW